MGRSDADGAARAAMLCAAAVIAQQVGAKATRDAMSLSSFDVSALPTVIMASALASIAFALLVSRALTGLGAARVDRAQPGGAEEQGTPRGALKPETRLGTLWAT